MGVSAWGGTLATKGHEGTSGGDRNALYLDCGDSYPGVSLKIKEPTQTVLPLINPFHVLAHALIALYLG